MTDKDFDNKMHCQTDLINYMECDKRWPICIFDFSFQSKMPNFFAFRVRNIKSHVVENHFFPNENPEVLAIAPSESVAKEFS